MKRTTQTTTRAAQGLKAERQVTTPTPEEAKIMLASGLDPSSGRAVREFRRHFRQMAREGGTSGL